jgi:cation:H+ antiporter
MFVSIFLILAGLALLAGGGELLVRGAVLLAKKLKLSAAVIGLTVVAAGTSVPELAVSVLAGISGNVDIAVGNVVGSNILNVTVILGVATLIMPLVVGGNIIKLEYPVMLLVTLLGVVVMGDGVVGRLDAVLLLATYIGFVTYLVSIVRERMLQAETLQINAEVDALAPPSEGQADPLKASLLVGLGIIFLGLGAELTVRGAVEIGRWLGLSERVIGLTIVAFGTSLPEVVTSIVAALRGRDDVALANIVGSNLFNITVILGLSAMVSPLVVSLQIISYDLWWMLAVATFLFPCMRSGLRISRIEGAILAALGVGYTISLFVSFGA